MNGDSVYDLAGAGSWELGARLDYQEFQKEKNFDGEGKDENEIFHMITKY